MGRGGEPKGTTTRRKTRANSLGLQWWRKLTLPRRGKKDSKLSPGILTTVQKQRIDQRRSSLFKAILSSRVSRAKHIARAEWDCAKNLAKVTIPRGNCMHSMGFFQNSCQYLYPEEALLLVDRGVLDFCINGIPASVQRAWAVTMSAANAMTLEQYLAFAYLRRAGYVVRRYNPLEGGYVKGLDIAFSVWRVGSYKRKEGSKPLFHLVVFKYEDFTPQMKKIVSCLDESREGKSRLRFAVIDRGVVVLTDVATNATPLSERFVKRLSIEEQQIANKIEQGDVTEYLHLDL